jgi:uncharacterized damage-inducible protein DinB
VTEGLIVDLLRVAHGLEADAHYLRARLFRAAALAVGARAGRSDLRLGCGLEGIAEGAIADLEREGEHPVLVSALREALRGIVEKTPPPSGGMPVSVCVHCGDVTLGAGHDMQPCPRCGAGPLAARPVSPAPYYDAAALDDVLAGLELTPRVLGEMCAGLDEKVAKSASWPVQDILDHLLGAQRLIWTRAQRMLDEEEPDLGAGVPPPRATDTGPPLTIGALLAAFDQERSQLLRRARGLGEREWERGGMAPGWGRTTVRQRLTYLVRHEHDHLGDLATSLAESGGA